MRSSIAGRLTGFAVAIAVAVMTAACAASPSVSPSLSEPSPAITPSAVATTTPSADAIEGPSATPTGTSPFALASDDFAEGGAIPVEYTCDGAGTSPELAWSGAPAGTVTYSLIVSDPDAGGFIHWLVYDMAPSFSELPAGMSTSTAGAAPSEGQNSSGKFGYVGPCPPTGTHHYVFRLLALDLLVQLRTGGVATASRILAAASGHTLGEATLTGTYRRH